MRKKTVFYIIAFLVIAGLAIYVVLTRSNSTLRGEFKDFAVKDTAAITKIFLADMNNNNLILERRGPGYWTINGGYKADIQRVKQLLEVIKNVEVKSPVPQKMRNEVIKSLATSNVKVEIYDGDKKVKTYFVGGTTQDELGTFMLIENSTEPYITYLSYFNGYLNIRYMPKVNEWRDKSIFTISPADIAGVEEVYPDMPDSSFKMEVKDDEFIVSAAKGKPEKIDAAVAKGFLLSLKDNYFEQIGTFSPEQKDSISNTVPALCIITVTSKNGTKKQLQVLRKRSDFSTKKEDKYHFDVEKYLGFLNGDKKNILFLQRDVIKKFMGTSKDF